MLHLLFGDQPIDFPKPQMTKIQLYAPKGTNNNGCMFDR